MHILKANVQSCDSCEEEPPIERCDDPSGDNEEKPGKPSGSDVLCTKTPKKQGNKRKKRREKYLKDTNLQ